MRKCKIGYPCHETKFLGKKIPFHIRRAEDGPKTDLYVAMLPMMHYHLVKYFDFHLSMKRMCFSIKITKFTDEKILHLLTRRHQISVRRLSIN